MLRLRIIRNIKNDVGLLLKTNFLNFSTQKILQNNSLIENLTTSTQRIFFTYSDVYLQVTCRYLPLAREGDVFRGVCQSFCSQGDLQPEPLSLDRNPLSWMMTTSPLDRTPSPWMGTPLLLCQPLQSGFPQIHNIGNNANVGIGGFAT